MGFLSRIRDFAAKNPGTIDAAVGKAGDLFDQRTGGKHARHTDTAQAKAGEFLTGRTPATPDGSTDAAPAASPPDTPPDTPPDAPGTPRPPTGGRSPA